ncbi:unnamed protein product, partial [Ixodes hexagonus]
VLLLLLTLAALQRHGTQARPAAPNQDSLDPMDAYLRDMPDPLRHKASPGGGGFAASESIESPSRKLQLPDASHEEDGVKGSHVPFGTRLKPPRQYGAIVSKPPPLLADDKARPPPEKTRQQKPERTRPGLAKGAVRSPGNQKTSTTARPRLPSWTPPPNIVIDSRRTRPLPPPPTPSPPPPRAPQRSQAPQTKRRQSHTSKAKTSLLQKARKGAPPPADSFNRTRTTTLVNGTKTGNGTLPGNPKPQASFFFTNVGPNHFEYRGVFDQNAVPISFRDNPETLFQLIPQLPRLFDDPFTPPKSPPTQILLQPPPKIVVDHHPPPPPPLTLLQPVVNFLDPPPPPPEPRQRPALPERQLFPKYDYIRGPQYPKIFKFNDERISILEFERSKREGRFVKRRGDSLDPDRVARSNFLIFHGGLFNAQRRGSNDGGFGNVVSPPRSEPLFAPYKSPYEPLPPPPVEYVPIKPTFAKNKPGGFVYFIRT